MYRHALTIREQQSDKNHPATALSLNNLALLYVSQGRYGEAEPLLVRTLDILEQKLGVKHPNTEMVRENLRVLQEEMGG